MDKNKESVSKVDDFIVEVSKGAIKIILSKGLLIVIIVLLLIGVLIGSIVSMLGTDDTKQMIDNLDNRVVTGKDIAYLYQEIKGKDYAIVVKNTDYTTNDKWIYNSHNTSLGINYNALAVIDKSDYITREGKYYSDKSELVSDNSQRFNRMYEGELTMAKIKDMVDLDGRYDSVLLLDKHNKVIGFIFEEEKNSKLD